MKNLKISAKLLVSFGGVVLFVVLLGVVSLLGFGSINQMVNQYASETLPQTEYLGDIRRNMAVVERYLVESIATVDQTERESMIEETLKQRQFLSDSIDAFRQVAGSTSSLLAEYETRLGSATQYRQDIVNILKRPYSDENEAQALAIYKSQYVPAYDRANETLIQIADEMKQLTTEQRQQAERISFTAKTFIFIVWILAVIFTVFMIVLIRKSILTPVREIEHVVSEMAQGRLNSNIKYQSKDEFGMLANGLKQSITTLEGYIVDIHRAMGEMAKGNFDLAPSQPFLGDFKQIEDSITQMIINLCTTLNKINDIANQVSNEAEQVSSYAQTLAQGTEEQASSVEELSASIQEIATRVKHNAEDTHNANTMVTEAVTLIQSSNDQMQTLLSSIHDIDAKSQEIRKINKTIEDIAFQTNILALNAAVEAARAGVAGKGFAVVADEVRNLAAKSAEAAQNTTALIEGTVSTSAQGVKNTEATAEQLNKAVRSVLSAADIISGITSSSEQQAQAIEQITIGLSQVSKVVQTNSASSEESAAASEELSGQAELLKTLVGQFKLKDFGTSLFQEEIEPPKPRAQLQSRSTDPFAFKDNY